VSLEILLVAAILALRRSNCRQAIHRVQKMCTELNTFYVDDSARYPVSINQRSDRAFARAGQ